MKIFIMDVIKLNINYEMIDGSNIHKWELVHNLLKLKNEIHILSSENTIPKYENLVLHTIPKTVQHNRLENLTFLLDTIKSNDFDILYTRTPANVSGFAGYLAKKRFGKPLVFEINGISYQEKALGNRSSKNLLKFYLAKARMYKEIFMWKLGDRIIAVTPGIKEVLLKHGVSEKKIYVIENGANTDLFRPMNKENSRRDLGLDEDSKYVCFVGSFAPWQGVELLIKAIPLIIEKDVHARFLIVGDGVMKKEWMGLAEYLGVLGKCIFTGSVPYEMVPTYINASDICVVPKKPMLSGYSPLKLYEYMACGKPIIATRTKGFELLEETNSGILINPENPVEFAKSTLMLLENPELMINMGNSGRKYVVANHSWESIAKKVESVCKNLIEDPGN